MKNKRINVRMRRDTHKLLKQLWKPVRKDMMLLDFLDVIIKAYKAS